MVRVRVRARSCAVEYACGLEEFSGDVWLRVKSAGLDWALGVERFWSLSLAFPFLLTFSGTLAWTWSSSSESWPWPRSWGDGGNELDEGSLRTNPESCDAMGDSGVYFVGGCFLIGFFAEPPCADDCELERVRGRIWSRGFSGALLRGEREFVLVLSSRGGGTLDLALPGDLPFVLELGLLFWFGELGMRAGRGLSREEGGEGAEELVLSRDGERARIVADPDACALRLGCAPCPGAAGAAWGWVYQTGTNCALRLYAGVV